MRTLTRSSNSQKAATAPTANHSSRAVLDSDLITQNGTFSVPWGETGGATVLPLTGVTVSGRCEIFTPVRRWTSNEPT